MAVKRDEDFPDWHVRSDINVGESATAVRLPAIGQEIGRASAADEGEAEQEIVDGASPVCSRGDEAAGVRFDQRVLEELEINVGIAAGAGPVGRYDGPGMAIRIVGDVQQDVVNIRF